MIVVVVLLEIVVPSYGVTVMGEGMTPQPMEAPVHIYTNSLID